LRPAIDPRRGDIEDDASSSKRRSLLSLAGSLLAEISLPKLVVAFTLLVVVPGLALGSRRSSSRSGSASSRASSHPRLPAFGLPSCW
jgi:hypothetical protein